MKSIFQFLIFSAVFFLQGCADNEVQPATISKKDTSITAFVCLPCGRDCDTTVYTKEGNCNECHMQLVNKASIVFNTILPKDLYAFITAKGKDKILLLDVRTPEEFNGSAPDKFGRLSNAINIPVQQLEARIHELDAYKNKEVIVYCSHSHRSPAASYLLTQNGFTHVTNMLHGMYVWKEEVKDKASNDSLYIVQ